ncbi:hypothetical protein BD324DRAFT_653133 [Kockovaella imperatae]|uniref:Zn(2)-C6 fungal-type domain-containing protein n=1 Tax=Kockovaella imperatae TaxID=4999 RepID=A0A1Y1UB97_9TREE|nr:hypothetical protein BD324DRAFT_653133 [Kockovaella imperatae]ORX34355.1 hypothetical protein BD324DRAFT_653133 [Kockovaella imperatae]
MASIYPISGSDSASPSSVRGASSDPPSHPTNGHHPTVHHHPYQSESPFGRFDHGKKKNVKMVSTNGVGDSSPKEGPVKAACLSCRSKKAKCDGVKPVCAACAKKGLLCEYVKSRRGGPRVRRPPPPSALRQFLSKLDAFWVDRGDGVPCGQASENEDTTNIVRTFSSRDEILRCYYTELHPFLPVMPLRKWIHEVSGILLPKSPFLLASSTLLVLAPHTQDPAPGSPNSKRLRSAAAHQLAQETITTVDQLISAGQANVECVQALTMLSMYTWGATLNLGLTNTYAERAINLSIQLGMNFLDHGNRSPTGNAVEDGEWQKDMIRRTFWVAYAQQMVTTLSAGLPAFMPYTDESQFEIDFPACTINDRSWSQWINAQRRIQAVLEAVGSVYYQRAALQASTHGMTSFNTAEEVQRDIDTRRQMINMDTEILNMLKKTEQDLVVEFVPGGEEEVVRNLQLAVKFGMAAVHIHIHRHQAFPEVSLFSKIMCGLPGLHQNVEVSSDSPVGSTDMSALPSSSGTASNMAPAVSNSVQQVNSTPGSDTLISDYVADEYTDMEALWQPETFPEHLPEPWFAHSGGAGALYAPVDIIPAPFVPLAPAAQIIPPGAYSGQDGRPVANKGSSSGGSPVPSTQSAASSKPSKPWGVDDDDKPEKVSEYESHPMTVFPPGVSLERCATAARAIIRLEVLHRSAQIAMYDGAPRWMPFCSCGLVVGAYAFLLLALAVQAEHAYQTPSKEAVEQIEGLLTNVKVIVAGLEAYGVMWDGIGQMGREVRAALEAAARLPDEMRAQMVAYQNSDQTALTNGNGYGDSVYDHFAEGSMNGQLDENGEVVQVARWV